MPYTEYRFDPKWIKARAKKMRANLIKNRPGEEPLAFAIQLFRGRLVDDMRSYLDYGPWWWAVKAILTTDGRGWGSTTHPDLLAVYRFDDPYETLIAADAFREENLKTNARYTNQFMLDGESGEWSTIRDSDMEVTFGGWGGSGFEEDDED